MAVCMCGHADDEHGDDPQYPGSTACHGETDDGPCDCIAFEEDEEEDGA